MICEVHFGEVSLQEELITLITGMEEKPKRNILQTTIWPLNLELYWSSSEPIELKRKMAVAKQMNQWCKNMNWCYEILLSGLVCKHSNRCVCFDPYCAQSTVLPIPGPRNISFGNTPPVLIHSKYSVNCFTAIEFRYLNHLDTWCLLLKWCSCFFFVTII